MKVVTPRPVSTEAEEAMPGKLTIYSKFLIRNKEIAFFCVVQSH